MGCANSNGPYPLGIIGDSRKEDDTGGLQERGLHACQVRMAPGFDDRAVMRAAIVVSFQGPALTSPLAATTSVLGVRRVRRMGCWWR